ncbi:hypothetical protein MHHHKEFG_01454 [Bacillus pumilus]
MKPIFFSVGIPRTDVKQPSDITKDCKEKILTNNMMKAIIMFVALRGDTIEMDSLSVTSKS